MHFESILVIGFLELSQSLLQQVAQNLPLGGVVHQPLRVVAPKLSETACKAPGPTQHSGARTGPTGNRAPWLLQMCSFRSKGERSYSQSPKYYHLPVCFPHLALCVWGGGTDSNCSTNARTKLSPLSLKVGRQELGGLFRCSLFEGT